MSLRPFSIQSCARKWQRSEKAWLSCAGVTHGRWQFVFVAAWQRYKLSYVLTDDEILGSHPDPPDRCPAKGCVMARGELGVEHLLRRAGFGASQDDLKQFEGTSVSGVLQQLLDYESQPDDVDTKIGMPGYAFDQSGQGLLSKPEHRACPPAVAVPDASFEAAAPGEDGAFLAQPLRDRLQKIAGGSAMRRRPRCWRSRPGELPGPRGQLELFRRRAGQLSRSADRGCQGSGDAGLARRPLNTRQRPQENFGREIMELFTFGIGNYTELDVYAAARVFTGWNLRLVGRGDELENVLRVRTSIPTSTTRRRRRLRSLSIGDGSKTIPARAAADGMQDGIDFITALATHPEDRPSGWRGSCGTISSATPSIRIPTSSAAPPASTWRTGRGSGP